MLITRDYAALCSMRMYSFNGTVIFTTGGSIEKDSERNADHL